METPAPVKDQLWPESNVMDHSDGKQVYRVMPKASISET